MRNALGLGAVYREPGSPCELRTDLCVPAGHPVLAGHFPGAPVVPGVLLLDAVRQACEVAWQRPLQLGAVDDARFTAPLLPAVVASLRAEVVEADGGLAVAGEWATASGRIAAFRLRLRPRA